MPGACPATTEEYSNSCSLVGMHRFAAGVRHAADDSRPDIGDSLLQVAPEGFAGELEHLHVVAKSCFPFANRFDLLVDSRFGVRIGFRGTPLQLKDLLRVIAKLFLQLLSISAETHSKPPFRGWAGLSPEPALDSA